MIIYEIYDEEGDFVCMFTDNDLAYDYAQKNEPEPNSWEVKTVERDDSYYYETAPEVEDTAT